MSRNQASHPGNALAFRAISVVALERSRAAGWGDRRGAVQAFDWRAKGKTSLHSKPKSLHYEIDRKLRLPRPACGRLVVLTSMRCANRAVEGDGRDKFVIGPSIHGLLEEKSSDRLTRNLILDNLEKFAQNVARW